jgi:transposase
LIHRRGSCERQISDSFSFVGRVLDVVQDEDGLHGCGRPVRAAAQLGEDFPGFEGRVGAFTDGANAGVGMTSDASSGDQNRHRLSRAGNRRINRTLHIMAVVQLRRDTEGRAYYRRKLAAAKTAMEAMRCLERRLPTSSTGR